MRTTPPILSWLQLNVALHRGQEGDGLRSARGVFAELVPKLPRWRRDGIVDSFHFMRKPPDLRLRFRGPDPAEALLDELTGSLERLRGDAVERFFTSVYEPETHLFGGVDSMALIHDFFDVDTDAWLELDQLWAAGLATLRPEIVTCTVMNDLLILLLDSTEIWDVWFNLTGILGPAASTSLSDLDMPPLMSAASWEHACSTELRVLHRYRAANRALADGLLGVWSAGRLECGLRGMLPFVIIFHFHRYGITGSQQAAIAAAMREAWNPRFRMRGGMDDPGPHET